MIDREFCYRVNKNIELLVERFAEKYRGTFDEIPEIYCVEEESDCIKWNFYFGDMHFNADEMFTALRYNIPKEKLFAWNDIQSGNVSGPKISLKNFIGLKEDEKC